MGFFGEVIERSQTPDSEPKTAESDRSITLAKVENKAAGRPIDPERVKKAQYALILHGGNVVQAAKALGCQARTIYSYIDKGLIDPTLKEEAAEHLETLEQLTASRHQSMAVELFDTAERALGQVNARLHEASARDAMAIGASAIEKSQLLQGKATSRVDLNVTNDLETLRRHGILIEAEAEEILDAEVVGD